jgi:hypothetical protein
MWAQGEWAQHHRQFDYKTTFNNFISKGGFLTFSVDEKKKFSADIEKIAAHSGMNIPAALTMTLDRLTTQEFQNYCESVFPPDMIKGLETPRDLLRALDEFIKRDTETSHEST